LGCAIAVVHGYFDVDPDIVWRTVTDEPPPLVAALRALLPQAR
jgi:uncharacterized protein with HEPN domain